MSDSKVEAVHAVLAAFRLPIDESLAGQLIVFMDALEIMHDRNTTKYKDLWKRYGAQDSLAHMRSKLSRAEILMDFLLADDQTPPEAYDCDDAYDLINYTAFFIRNVKAGRLLLSNGGARPGDEL